MNKGYRQTEEHRKKIGDANRGRIGGFAGRNHSEDTKKKMSGKNNYMWKKVHSLETRKKISKATKKAMEDVDMKKIGKKISQNAKNNPNYGMRGKSQSLEARKKMSLAKKGKPLSDEHRMKLRESCKGINSGENNAMWGKTGKKCPNWLDGKSFEPYPITFNNKFKRAIRKRENYTCLKCGKHQEREKRALSVHHINYNKMLTTEQNCCAVCRSCNGEVNKNRKHWTKFFQSLLSEKYGYKYSNKGEIILDLNKEVSAI